MWTYSEREISDLHKDVFGFRPDNEWWNWWEMADHEDRQMEWDWLIEELKTLNETNR